MSPLTQLLRKSKNFEWTDECQESFQRIKDCLVEAPILCCPDYSLPFSVQTDASGYGIGAVLSQPHPKGDRVICYLSRSLSKQERKYSATELECLAVLWSIEKLRPYLEVVPFTVITDHYSLKWLHNLKDPTGRLAHWSVRLQQYDFGVIHRKGKEHVVPDMLSRSVPCTDVAEISDEVEGCEDKWYKKMLRSVESSPLQFRNWRRSGNQLYKYVKPEYPALALEADNWKRVVPRSGRLRIIKEAHDPPTSGHFGHLQNLFQGSREVLLAQAAQ